jgi:large subunit ribosomal protein L24
VTGRIKADRSAALFDQIEFQYGPDNRAIKLRGTADLALGNTPELAIALSAMQVDLDRVLALPDDVRRRPLDAVVNALAQSATGIRQLPIPVRVGISIENAILAGAALQRLVGEFWIDADSWHIETLEFRAPGATQVRLSGSLDTGSKELLFSGPVSVETADDRSLIGWLTDRNDAPPRGSLTGTLPARLNGRIVLSQERAVVTQLAGNIGGAELTGQIEIGLTHPVTVDGELKVGEIDLPAIIAAFTGVSAQGPATAALWPAEPFEQGLLGQVTGQVKVSAANVLLAPMLAAKQARGLAHFGESTLALDGIDGHYGK